MTLEEVLNEREKELACLYTVCLLATANPTPQVLVDGIARALCTAVHHDESCGCIIRLTRIPTNEAFQTRRGPAVPLTADLPRIESPLPPDPSGTWQGLGMLWYPSPACSFLPQEQSLLDSIMAIMGSILANVSLFSRLSDTTQDLQAKNIALREVLSAIEAERRQLMDAFKDRLAGELLPLAEQALDSRHDPEQREAYLRLLRDELARETAAHGPALNPSFSPREREIALQIRNGRSSKEIAALLGISPATVERHRHNIRSKLGILDRPVNLSGILSNL